LVCCAAIAKDFPDMTDAFQRTTLAMLASLSIVLKYQKPQ
jgi:hypothetical protein